jgi:hypothetical protein
VDFDIPADSFVPVMIVPVIVIERIDLLMAGVLPVHWAAFENSDTDLSYSPLIFPTVCAVDDSNTAEAQRRARMQYRKYPVPTFLAPPCGRLSRAWPPFPW